jgi:tRNA-2-methylthio-N6-dimethylallyladenosine synthase
LEKKQLLFIHNFGCQMNLHDATRMEEILARHGYQTAATPEQASVILVNTCSVRQRSEDKFRSAIGRYSLLKDRDPDLLLGVAGCVAQQEGAQLFSTAPFLDLVFSPDHIADLPVVLQQAKEARRAQVGFVEPEAYSFLRAEPLPGKSGSTALLTIQKGCNHTCSYCIVPLVRGPEVSRPAGEILEEARSLVRVGVKEITLIGQNVNDYRGYSGRNEDFVALLRQMDRLEGLARLRFTTSHPKDFQPALSQCFAELEHLCPWLHLPVQSGSTQVLGRMNRGYSREEYLGIIDQVRRCRPDVSLGTDLIVGFPGETEAQFAETLSLLEEIQFDYAFSFKYSMRPGTPAAHLEDNVPEPEKSQRLLRLQKVQEEITRKRLASFVNQTTPVLIEGPSRKGLPQVSGRTPGNHVVNLSAPEHPEEIIGQILPVKVTRAAKHSLFGTIATE